MRSVTRVSAMNQGSPRALRLACDSCHRGKTKCPGGMPCSVCDKGGRPCTYSEPLRLGRPKGSKNKRPSQRPQVLETGNIRCDRSPYGLSSDAQTLDNLAQCQNPRQQRDQALDDAKDRNNLTASMRIQSDAQITAYVPTMLPMDFFDPPNDNASTLGSIVKQISDEEVAQTSSRRSRASRSRRNDVTASFNNDPTTGLAMSSEGSGTSFGTPQFPASRTPQPSLNSPDDFSVSSPNAANTSDATTCDCLDRQVQLLYQMDEVEQAQKDSSPDVALEAARGAMEHWERLRQCTACNEGDREGVFLMFVMCMRFLLRALRCAFANTAMTTIADQQRSSVENPAATCRSNWHVMVGAYEATGHESQLASRMLIVLAVRRIETALTYAKGRLQRRRAPARLGIGGDEGWIEAVAEHDTLSQGVKSVLFTKEEFESYVGLLLHGLEEILGST
jgi:hypothetical protein